MEIDTVDPETMSDADWLAVYEIDGTLEREEDPERPWPAPEMFIAGHRVSRPHLHRAYLLAREAGSVPGLAWVGWSTGQQNRRLARVHVGVLPQHRRRGLGRELAAAAAEYAEAHGRTLLQSWSSSRVPAGEAFSTALGATSRQVSHTNRLELADLDRRLLERWVAAGDALPGYELVFVESPAPAELLEFAAEILNVMNTAPRDDLDEEDETVTPEMVAAGQRAYLARGRRGWTMYARDRRTGRFVALTEVIWDPSDPAVVDQADTGVEPAHRGRGLAKWLKAAMLLKLLQEVPGARAVMTGNAYSNEAMLGINTALGFRPVGSWTAWEVEAARVRYTSAQSARPLE